MQVVLLDWRRERRSELPPRLHSARRRASCILLHGPFLAVLYGSANLLHAKQCSARAARVAAVGWWVM